MLKSRTAQWSAATVLICVVILTAAWLLAISPRRAAAQDLDDQNVAAQQANDALQLQIAQLKAQFATLPAKKADLALVRKQMPQTAGMPAFVKEVTALAAAAGVSLTSLTPGAAAYLSADPAGTPAGSGASAAGGSAVSIPVVLATKGGYFETAAFLKGLQTTLSRAFLVTGLQIAPDGTTGRAITSTITASVFSLPDPAAAGTP